MPERKSEDNEFHGNQRGLKKKKNIEIVFIKSLPSQPKKIISPERNRK